MSDNKQLVIFSGGTSSHVRPHLALSAKSYGSTGRLIESIARDSKHLFPGLDIVHHRTRDADSTSRMETNRDVLERVKSCIENPLTKIIMFNVAMVDFQGEIVSGDRSEEQSEHRLRSDQMHLMRLTAAPKVIDQIRAGTHGRKDIFLVGWKATYNATAQEQYVQGLNLLKRASCNLVVCNDLSTKRNMVVCPEEAVYHESFDRVQTLEGMMHMAMLRSQLTFTRSTVVDGEPVPWESELVYPVLRTIVDFCIERGAYKKFRGVTAGHFAAALSDTEFITSRRKTDYNDMKTTGLVRVRTSGPDTVLAYGSKPSVGGQSQRIIFKQHPQYDCVVHFHCPLKPGSQVPIASQAEFECGSHECGANTSRNLKQFGNLSAVFLDQHGPNIVFHHSIDPQEVINFIEANFNLEEKTGGYSLGAAQQ